MANETIERIRRELVDEIEVVGDGYVCNYETTAKAIYEQIVEPLNKEYIELDLEARELQSQNDKLQNKAKVLERALELMAKSNISNVIEEEVEPLKEYIIQQAENEMKEITK